MKSSIFINILQICVEDALVLHLSKFENIVNILNHVYFVDPTSMV